MISDLHWKSMSELAAGLRAREFSGRELVQTYLDRISALDDRVHAFVTVAAEEALRAGDLVDQRLARGDAVPPLAGIPIGIKDSIPTRDIQTTANSRVLEQWVPELDAAAVRRLRAAGAIVLGKTNLNELGWALPADDDLVPPTRSPWNLELAAIGSSTGSGAAVAAGFCAAAIGTDSGGSVRLPAGQNGLIGIKPTHGRVSRLGMDASSISEISPLARTVTDAALLLTALSGYEPDDPLSWPVEPPNYASGLHGDVRGLKIGVPWTYIASTEPEPEVTAAFADGLDALRSCGAKIVDVTIPGLADARAANFIVLNAEAYADHAPTLRAHPDQYGPSALRYHWMGAFLTAADYLNAKRVGRRIRHLVQEQFTSLYALVTPTSPVVTAEAARRPGAHRKGVNAAFTAPFNLTGHPAVSIPAGMSAATGLPIGMQLTGPLYGEETLLQLAYAHEQATNWSSLHPTLDVGRLTSATE